MAYLFTSKRLGFRSWLPSDETPFITMNADPQVMEHFPSTLSEEESLSLIERLTGMYKKKGYCYFAVDELESQTFIGFIGLAYQTYDAPFTPCTDIGWRLDSAFWGKGYATEGAFRCLEYGFDVIGLKQIVSVATKSNVASINVMKKIGMTYDHEFEHPALTSTPDLKTCVLYKLDRD